MLRPLVCLLLVPVLIANQAFALGCMHVHSSETSEDHSNRPHFHLGLHGPHHHDHHHVGHHHHHHGGAGQHSHNPFDCTTDKSEGIVEGLCDHDCDAIYLSSSDEFYFQLNRIQSAATLFWANDYVVVWPKPVKPIKPVLSPRNFPAGPFSHSRCALFLQILCLRI